MRVVVWNSIAIEFRMYAGITTNFTFYSFKIQRKNKKTTTSPSSTSFLFRLKERTLWNNTHKQKRTNWSYIWNKKNSNHLANLVILYILSYLYLYLLWIYRSGKNTIEFPKRNHPKQQQLRLRWTKIIVALFGGNSISVKLQSGKSIKREHTVTKYIAKAIWCRKCRTKQKKVMRYNQVSQDNIK